MTESGGKVNSLPASSVPLKSRKVVCRLHKKVEVLDRNEKKVRQHLDELGKILYDMGKAVPLGRLMLKTNFHISCFVLPG